MKQAYDCGINFFDTAEKYIVHPASAALILIGNSYAGGQSEIVMGKAIKKYNWKRNDIVVSTKVSNTSSLTFSQTTDSNHSLIGEEPTAKFSSTIMVCQGNTLLKDCRPRFNA
jgi:aryl-alcohol dehydrogenase-like predicted oxidoreductase